MHWVIYVNVCSWSWIRVFLQFIARSGFGAVECCVHSFFSNDFVLDVIFFLGVVILTWTRSLVECLLGVWCFHLISPEVLSFSLGQETLGLLTHQLPVLVLGLAIYDVLFYRIHNLVRAWTWIDVSDLGVFAVGHS